MSVGNVTEKGQVTIPKHLRDKYRINDKVYFVDAGEGVLVRRVPKLSELKGSLKGGVDKARQQDRDVEAAREQRLEELVERARKAGLSWK